MATSSMHETDQNAFTDTNVSFGNRPNASEQHLELGSGHSNHLSAVEPSLKIGNGNGNATAPDSRIVPEATINGLDAGEIDEGGSNSGQNASTNSGQNVLPETAGGDGQPGKNNNNDSGGLNKSSRVLVVTRLLMGAQSAQSNDPSSNDTTSQDIGTKGKGKQTYASFFLNNRVPSDTSKLTYISPPLGKLVLGIEEIDSVEDAFGFCLVGYVMGPRPTPCALLNFVKAWGNDFKFTFKENRWIRFQFSSEETRYRVLNGGLYMIFGRQLFLKKLPS